jgi:carbamoyltransferase
MIATITNFLTDINLYIKMANISFYGSHNAAYVVEENGKILLVLEVERFLNYKNSGIAQYMCPKVPDLLFLGQHIPKYIMKTLGISKFDNCYYLNTDVILDKSYSLEKLIPAKNYKHGYHHRSHAAGTFYQSPYKEALIFSFDGGGDDGKFNIYYADRKNSVNLLESVSNPILDNPHIKYDLGFPYMIFGQYLADIKIEPLSIGNLVYPGKIMGLASYGKVNEEWLPYFIEFYKSNPDGSHYGEWDDTGYYDYEPKINELGEQIGVKFDTQNRLKDQVAYDIAATSQRAFEECFLEIAEPYFDLFPDMPICITGGCGLNIILNTRLVEEFKREIFVGPNPNDCGIALGLMLDNIRPQKPVDITYSGLELLDIDSLGQYIQNSTVQFTSHVADISELAKDIADGKIIGVARGKAEHGARALGNRSIICNPSILEMKDILNAKVKHREWYRPFAPVVRLEDVNKYFEWGGESRWMTFCPKVKKEWRNKLTSITHVDNTARVQTVTREQNEWLYDLITEFEKETGIGVVLNTSFNVDGKPILSTIKDAFEILEKTQMDGLVLENTYIKK